MVSELSVLLDAARWERESMGVVITEVWRENAWKVLTQTISRNLCEVNITSHKDWRLEDGVFMKWWAISGTSGNPGRPSGSAPEVCTVLKKPARLAGTLPTFFPRKPFTSWSCYGLWSGFLTSLNAAGTLKTHRHRVNIWNALGHLHIRLMDSRMTPLFGEFQWWLRALLQLP